MMNRESESSSESDQTEHSRDGHGERLEVSDQEQHSQVCDQEGSACFESLPHIDAADFAADVHALAERW